jgi:hypothetical protein
MDRSVFSGHRRSIKERLFSLQKISGQAPLESDGFKSKTMSVETRRRPQPKQSQNQNLEMQRKRKEQRFLGFCREISSNRSGRRKGWANVTTPKRPLLPPFPLHFKVFGFDFVLVAASSRCVSRFVVLTLFWLRLRRSWFFISF